MILMDTRVSRNPPIRTCCPPRPPSKDFDHRNWFFTPRYFFMLKG